MPGSIISAGSLLLPSENPPRSSHWCHPKSRKSSQTHRCPRRRKGGHEGGSEYAGGNSGSAREHAGPRACWCGTPHNPEERGVHQPHPQERALREAMYGPREGRGRTSPQSSSDSPSASRLIPRCESGTSSRSPRNQRRCPTGGRPSRRHESQRAAVPRCGLAWRHLLA
jgi:hypothetical protein